MELVRGVSLPVEEMINPGDEHRREVERIRRAIAGSADPEQTIMSELRQADLALDGRPDALGAEPLVPLVEAITEYVVGHQSTAEKVNTAFSYFNVVPASYNTDIFQTVFAVTLARLGDVETAWALVDGERIVEPRHQEAVLAAIVVSEARRGHSAEAQKAYQGLFAIHPEERAQLDALLTTEPAANREASS